MFTPQLLEDRNPAAYAASAMIMQEIAAALIARLEWMALQPQQIVDVSHGLGECLPLLTARYPGVPIVPLNLSDAMRTYACTVGLASTEWVSSAADHFALPDQMADMVIANMVYPWSCSIPATIAESKRILRPEGLLLFSSLGPDTLRELTSPATLFPQFIDMHDIGDALIHAGFSDPVLDVEYITITYREVAQLVLELKALGLVAGEIDVASLTQDRNGVFALTCEVIYGHAWCPAASSVHASDAGVIEVPISAIRRKR